MKSRKRGLVRAALWAAGIATLLEAAALPALYVATGRWYSRDEIAATLREPTGAEGDALAPPSRPAPDWMSEHVLHPYLGFVRDASVRNHRFNGRPVGLPVNRHGFFGSPPDPPISSGAFVVAITGGSVALDFFLQAREAFVDSLRLIPEFADREIEVVSLALGGWKQPQQLAALTYFLSLGARFDMVVNVDGFNEVALPFAENVPYGVAYCFPRSWRTYAAKAVDFDRAAPMGLILEIRERTEKWRDRLSSSPWRRSTVVLAIWRAYLLRQEGREGALEDAIRGGLEEEGVPGYQESGPFEDYAAPGDLFADAARLWKRSSLQMWKACEANGIRYYHFLQPNQHHPGAKELTDWERRFALASPEYPHVRAVREGYPLLLAAGRELAGAKVPFFDLTGIYGNETGTIYVDACCHVDLRGNRILAGRIAAAIGKGP